jgi:hypothetical protein
MEKVVSELLKAPESQLSDGAKLKIILWSKPTKREIQETLDYCAHGADASSFVMQVMSAMLERASDSAP